jgi:hypothetical protein
VAGAGFSFAGGDGGSLAVRPFSPITHLHGFGVSLALGLDSIIDPVLGQYHGYNAKMAAALNVALDQKSVGSSKAMYQDPSGTPNCGHSRVRHYVDATIKAQSSLPYAPSPVGQNHLFTLNIGYADMYSLANGGDSDDPAAAIPRWKHAVRVMLSRFLAAYVAEESAITFGGAGWVRSDAAGLTEDRQSGSHFQVNTSDTDGATALWQTPHTFPPGTVPAFVGLAENGMDGTWTFERRKYDSAGTPGAWADEGVTIDISDVAPQKAGKVNAFCHRFTGLDPYTIYDLRMVGHSPSGGRALQVDCVQIESPVLTQAPVLVFGVSKPYSNAALFGVNVADRDAKTDTMIAEEKNLIAEFEPETGVPNPIRFVDVDGIIAQNLALFSPIETGSSFAPVPGSGDGIHWNADGHSQVVAGGLDAMDEWAAAVLDWSIAARRL